MSLVCNRIANPCQVLLTMVMVLLLRTVAKAEDWPTHMHDNGRSGVTADLLESELTEQWVYRAPVAPQPAWPDPQSDYNELPKMKFDDALYTVAVGESVYFGSSVDNCVYALDAATGKVRWKFATGGPVRLAPTVAKERVYFGSDDGKVYCLKAADGTLVWSHHAALDSRRVLGNGRVISLWPIRTSVVVEGDRVYCGAGVFQYEDAFMLVLNADDGRVVWKNDAVIRSLGGVSPQGYLLMCERGVMVPNGRNRPFCVDRATGQVPPPVKKADAKSLNIGKSGNLGGTYGVMVDQTLYIGTQNTLYPINTQSGEVLSAWPSARRLLATPENYYVLKGSMPPLFGKRPVTGASNEIAAVARSIGALSPTNNPVNEAVLRWKYAHPDLTSMILAGNRLVAGGSNEVAVLDAKTGKELWTGRVNGLAVGLTVAQGRLLVSTTEGAIHCFAKGSLHVGAAASGDTADPDRMANRKSPLAAAPTTEQPPQPKDLLDDMIAQSAQAILRESGVQKGYALITGFHAGHLACELARQSELNVTCIEFDPQQAILSRKRLDALGLPAARLTVDVGAPDSLPYPEFAANLVVHMDGPGQKPFMGKELLRVLKPCGGVLLLGSAAPRLEKTSQPDAATLDLWRKAGALSQNTTVIPGGDPWTKLVRGVLEGSGWWTHCFADAGNTGSSGDQRINGKLGVLWFGGPGADEFPDRHTRNVPPLVMNGRVFCQGFRFAEGRNTLLSFDAYNGVRYWDREIPGATRLGLPGVSGNLACTADSLFVAAGSKCHRLDAVTGVTKTIYETPRAPDGSNPGWGYVAVANGILFGSTSTKTTPSKMASHNALWDRSRFSDTIFAFDIESGKQLWVYRGKEIRDSMIAFAKDRLFFVENRGQPTTAAVPGAKKITLEHDEDDAEHGKSETKTDRRGQAIKKSFGTPLPRTVVALEAATGKTAWEKGIDLMDCGRWDASAPPESPGFRELQALCKDDVLVFASEFHHHDRAAGDDLLRRVMALSTLDGSVLWSKPVGNLARPVIMHGALLADPCFYNLRTGELIEKQDPKTGKAIPWKLSRSGGGCGSYSACDALVFFRSGYASVLDGSNASFQGMRPGCFINIIPAGGVVVEPEASSGCTCNHAVQCTIVYSPNAKE